MKVTTFDNITTYNLDEYKPNMGIFFSISFLAIFAQVTVQAPEGSGFFSSILDQWNLVLNAAAVAGLGYMGKWVATKLTALTKSMTRVLDVSEEFAGITQTITSIKTDQDVMKRDVSEIKKNTSAEINEMKTRFLEVLNTVHPLMEEVRYLKEEIKHLKELNAK